MTMLEAIANIQMNLSLILEAKAAEAEKTRNWLCHHETGQEWSDPDQWIRRPLEIHKQIVELIDGLTKLENSLARNMQVILRHDDGDAPKRLGGLLGEFNGFEERDA
jgi:hypothetical protein